jgi:hypothetical protein
VAAFCWGYDSVEMMLCSKNQNLNLFCRWCLGEPSGSGVGPFYLEKREGAFWRKVAVCWRLVLWSFSKVVGGMF